MGIVSEYPILTRCLPSCTGFLLFVLLVGTFFPLAHAASSMAINTPGQATERPDFAEVCPSSEERAKPWGTRLLKTEELTGRLDFLNVEYPYRDYDKARDLFLQRFPIGAPVSEIAKLYADHEIAVDRWITTRYRNEELWSFWSALKARIFGPERERLFLFVVDEGCGNLTVWQVGAFSQSNGALTRLHMRRVYDDQNFTKRGVSFRYVDFDQAFYCYRCIRNALYSIADDAFRNGGKEFEAVKEALVAAGATASQYVGNPYGWGFSYTPNYFDSQSFTPWYTVVTLSHETNKIVQIDPSPPLHKGGIESTMPNPTERPR